MKYVVGILFSLLFVSSVFAWPVYNQDVGEGYSLEDDRFIVYPRTLEYQGTYGGLAEENVGLGTEYILGTTYTTVTSFQTYKTSPDIGVDSSLNSLTLGESAGGEFLSALDLSILVTEEAKITFGIFLNDTTIISSITRTIVGGHNHEPVFMNVSVGTFADLTSLRYLTHEDGDSITINEVQGNTPGWLVDFIFNGSVLAPHHVGFSVLYDGAPTDEVECQVWNYTLSRWDDVRESTKDIEDGGGSDAFRYLHRDFEFPAHGVDYVDVINREAKVRVIHTSVGGPGHTVSFDAVYVHDRHNAAAIALTSIILLRDDDTVSIKMKSNTDDVMVWLQNMHLGIVRISK